MLVFALGNGPIFHDLWTLIWCIATSIISYKRPWKALLLQIIYNACNFLSNGTQWQYLVVQNVQSSKQLCSTGIPSNCNTIYFFTLETSENIHFQMENLYWGVKIVTKKGKYNTLWHNSFQARPHSKWSIHWYDRERRMVAGCQINTFLDILVFFSKEAAWIKKVNATTAPLHLVHRGSKPYPRFRPVSLHLGEKLSGSSRGIYGNRIV